MATLRNLARVRSATVGAGALTLGPAVTGFLTFALAGVLDGETVSYGIFDYDGAGNHIASEVGRGVYNAGAGTLTRVPLDSTNGGAALNLSGNEHVFITILTEDMDHASGSIANVGTNTHAQIDTHIASVANPHSVTAAQVGAYTTVQSDTLFQPKDATLTSISALGTAANKMLYTTGVDTWAEADLSAFGRSLIDDADATAARATLGLGSASVISTPISAANGGTGIANGASATLTLPNLAITLGGGGAAQTYTLPAAGGTFALLNAANVFTAAQKINVNSTTAFVVEQDGVNDNVFIVDTANARVGINMTGMVSIFEIPGYINNSSAKFGSYELQSYSINNAWLGENTYYNGSAFIARGTGWSSIVRFRTGEIKYEFTSGSNAAGTNLGNTLASVPLKITNYSSPYNNSVALGGNINPSPGDVGGATIIATGSAVEFSDGKNMIFGTTTGTKIGTATSQKLGFFGHATATQPSAYTPSNVTTDRTYDANATSLDEIADVLGTLIADFQSLGLVG